MKPPFALFLVLVFTAPLAFAAPAPDWPQGEVTLAVPWGTAFTLPAFPVSEILSFSIEPNAQGEMTLEEHADWETRDFTKYIACYLAPPKVDTDHPERVLMVATCGEVTYLIYAVTRDLAIARGWFERILVRGKVGGPEVAAHKVAHLEKMAAAIFTGPAARLPLQRRLALVKLAEKAGKHGLSVGSHRDRPSFVLEVGEHPEVFVEAKVEQAERIARAVEDRLLGMAREVEEVLGDSTEIGSVVLTTLIFRSKETPNLISLERFSLTLPRTELRRYLNGEITAQQLVDAGDAVLDEKPYKVALKKA